MSLVEELRSKQSRDNRELLDRAACEIERLQKAYNGLVADVKTCGVRDVCFICKAYNSQPECEFDCMECKLKCPCRECRECSHWKWRGEE